MAKSEAKLSYYAELTRGDIVAYFEGLIRRQILKIRESDGKLIASHRLAIDTPWIHVRHLEGLFCDVWHKLTFEVISPQVGKIIVPRACQDCWKVVVRPNTLKQLFDLLEMQYALNVPSKCGIEKRDYVPALYGGYFYNIGFENGLNRWKQVRDYVDNWLGTDVSVILKRGCTEFEVAFGDSKYYDIPEWQERIEDLVKEFVAHDDETLHQPEHNIKHIKRSWIQWAFANGDETYKLYTNGEPLSPTMRTYHHLYGCSRDELIKFWNTADTIKDPYNPKGGNDNRKTKVQRRSSSSVDKRQDGQKEKDKGVQEADLVVNNGRHYGILPDP